MPKPAKKTSTTEHQKDILFKCPITGHAFSKAESAMVAGIILLVVVALSFIFGGDDETAPQQITAAGAPVQQKIVEVDMDEAQDAFEDAQDEYKDGDFEDAAEELQIAAEAGIPQAMMMLGQMYMQGKGVEQNRVLAYKWLSLSRILGYTAANSVINVLVRGMPKSEIQEAQDMVRAWKTAHGK